MQGLSEPLNPTGNNLVPAAGTTANAPENERDLKKIKHFSSEIESWNPNSHESLTGSEITSHLKIYEPLQILIYQQGKSLHIVPLENFSEAERETIDFSDEDYLIQGFNVMREENVLFVSIGYTLKWYKLEKESKITLANRGSCNLQGIITSFAFYEKTVICSLMDNTRIYYKTYNQREPLMEFLDSAEIPLKNAENIFKIIITSNILVLAGDKGSLIFNSFHQNRKSLGPFVFPDNFKSEMNFPTRITLLEASEKTNMMMIVADSHTISLWNIGQNKFQSQLIGHTEIVTIISFFHSGNKAISCDVIQTIIIWNVLLSSQLGKIKIHFQSITNIIITDDDRYLITSSNDKTIKITDMESFTVEAELRGHKKKINNIACHEGKIYSTSKDNSIRKWNLADQKESLKLEFPEKKYIEKVDCKGGNILVLTDSDITSYSVSNNEVTTLESNTEILCSCKITHLSFTEDGNNLIYVRDDTNSFKMIDFKILQEQENDNLNDQMDETIKSPNLVILKLIEQDKILLLDENMNLSLSGSDGNVLSVKNIHKDYGEIILFETISFDKLEAPDQKGTKLILMNELGTILLVSIDHGTNAISETEEFEKPVFMTKNKPKNLLFISQDIICFSFEQDCKIYILDLANPNNLKIREHQKEVTNIIKVEKDINNQENGLKSDFLISVSVDFHLKVWAIKYLDATKKDISEVTEYFTIIEHKELVTDLIDVPNSDFVASSSVDGKVILYNIPERRIESIYHSHNMKVIGMKILNPDPNSTLILSYTKKSIHLWDINEYKSQTGIKVKGTHDPIEKFIVLYKLKYFKEILPSQRFVSFGDSEFTFLHYYLYRNQYQLAESALNKNFLISQTFDKDPKFRNSPLIIAIKAKSVTSIKVFIEYLNFLSLSGNTHRLRCICFCIRNDLIELIQCGTSKLFEFFESIFFRVEEPKILNNYGELPSLTYSDNFLHEEHFEDSQSGALQQDDILIEKRSCMMLLPVEFGTQRSVEFLNALDECKIQSVLRSNLIKSIIDSKWNSILWYLRIHSTMIWLILVLITMILLDFHIILTSILILCLTAVLGIYEVFQIIGEKGEYFCNIWNLFDMAVLIFDTLWAILIICGFDFKSGYFQWITLVVVFFSFIRGISCFRIFDGTRYYIQLILKSINDVGYFFIIYAYTTITFAVMFLAADSVDDSNQGNTSPLFYFKSSYDENIGGLDSDIEKPLFYIAFMIASIINVTIMLNLLISILGDTFDNFQMNASEIDTKEKLQGIIEIEGSISLFRDVGDLKFIHMSLQVEFDEQEEQWEGKIKLLEKKIDNLSRKMTDESKKQNEALRMMENRNIELLNQLFHKVDSLQDSIPNAIKQAKHK